ncbi:Uncharacterised protein [Mycobacteroides abscessus subsp. bolletii]|nr:Uncharacterised protein [Mycobacteroides abscessus subsp. bolletii]
MPTDARTRSTNAESQRFSPPRSALSVGSTIVPSMSLPTGGPVTAGQPGALVGASHSSNISGSARTTVIEAPAMPSAVTKLPTRLRPTAIPAAASCAATSPKRRLSSSEWVAPSPLTTTITSSPDRTCAAGRMRASSAATISAAGATGARSTPRSPWIPTPISISPVGRLNDGTGAPGTVHGDSATAMLRADAATRRPSAATAASWSPRSAAAPHSFSTTTVAAVPRRPGLAASVTSVATSSSTNTTSVRTEDSPAIWRAMEKFITSPV